jgi:hypothetical protein
VSSIRTCAKNIYCATLNCRIHNLELSICSIVQMSEDCHMWLIILLFLVACETVLKLESNGLRPEEPISQPVTASSSEQSGSRAVRR